MGCGPLLRGESDCTTVTANLQRSIPALRTIQQEPGAGKPHAGNCAGAGSNPVPTATDTRESGYPDLPPGVRLPSIPAFAGMTGCFGGWSGRIHFDRDRPPANPHELNSVLR